MLAHRKNIEWLCCYPNPVAYAHRQRSAALRAKTKKPYTRSASHLVIPPSQSTQGDKVVVVQQRPYQHDPIGHDPIGHR
jgi:hypothetical protein